ncbi:Uncharacterised protein [Cedecea neteri]|uniref:Uncharacterized protein n=1 Tax=Cedecea neteri TaxID=158822 RepID=A0A2X3JBK6_9ENTR|nr:Uncharacterised protein [Cedecea neteri]
MAPGTGVTVLDIIDEAELTPDLARRLAHQCDEGLMVLPRCAMRYLLREGEPAVGKTIFSSRVSWRMW